MAAKNRAQQTHFKVAPDVTAPVKGINQSEVVEIALQIWLALTDAALMAGFGRCCAFLCELLSDIACVTL